MTTATLSEVSAAVANAFNAGAVGEKYEGIMPAAYDAGTAWATEVSRDWVKASDQQGYLTSLLKTAEVGFTDARIGKPMRGPDYQGETVIMQTALLWQANRSVYVQAYETGAAVADAGKMNWTPWLIGAGALAVVGIGAVVMTRKSNPGYGYAGNPSKGKGERQQHSEGAEIIDNMAKVVWAEFWASREEEKGRSFGGVDIFYAAPEPPAAAKRWALEQARKLAEMNGLDPRHPYAAMEELYARAVAANEAAGKDSEPAHRFGSDLGMMVTGSGVSWFDDNAEFNLKKPYAEFWI